MKRKSISQTKGKEADLVEQRNVVDERPQRLGAVVAKIQMDDISSDEQELEDSDHCNDNDFASKSQSSDSFFY